MSASTIRVAAAVAICTGALLSACGDEGSNGDAGGGGEAAKDKPARIALVVPSFANPYFVQMREGAEAEAKKRGVKLVSQGGTSATAAEAQTAALQNLVASNHDCYAASTISDTNLIQPAAQIVKKQRHFIVVDGPWSFDAAKAAGATISTIIGADSEAAGKMAGEKMAEKLGGKGDVAIIGGPTGDTQAEARHRGFTIGAKAGGLRVVQRAAADYDRAKALAAATDIIRAHPSVKGFYAANDVMALGAVTAAQNLKRSDIAVIGTDGAEDAFQAIKAGKMTGTIAQYPYAEGVLAVDACLALINGDKVPAVGDAPIEYVDEGNVDTAIGRSPQPMEAYDNPYPVEGA